MDPTKQKRSNKETVRKPYRSNTATYEEYKKEIPDANYYGRKHSEFKRPWLPGESYDEMEYKFDFPLSHINPITVDFEWPDGSGYPFPGGTPYDPKTHQTGWNPNYPMPDPQPFATQRTDPQNAGSKITWDCDAPASFQFCPGEDISLTFEEAWNNPIISIVGQGGAISAGKSNVPAGSAMGTRQVTIHIPENFTATWYTVTATTRNGLTCSVTGMKKSYCGETACAGVSIGYTSTQMTTGTSQTLYLNNPKEDVVYEWSLSGGGSIVEIGEGNARYTAPETNASCSDSPTVELRVKGTTQVCASITFSITSSATAGQGAYYIKDMALTLNYPICSDNLGGGAVTCTGPLWTGQDVYYSCSGQEVDRGDSTGWCFEDCDDPPTDACHTNAHAMCNQLVDTRTAAQILAGCCPSALA